MEETSTQELKNLEKNKKMSTCYDCPNHQDEGTAKGNQIEIINKVEVVPKYKA